MKYITPTIDIEVLETSDVVATSKGGYEISNEGEGKGNIIFGATSIFG